MIDFDAFNEMRNHVYRALGFRLAVVASQRMNRPQSDLMVGITEQGDQVSKCRGIGQSIKADRTPPPHLPVPIPETLSKCGKCG